MALTQEQLDILAQGGVVDFGLPVDPGLISDDGIFFDNVFFQTVNGNSSTTPQGLLSLELTNDLGNFMRDDTFFIVRNAQVTVADDFGTTSGDDSIISISGSTAQVTLTGGSPLSSNPNPNFRLAGETGREASATAFISDGARVTIDNVDPNGSRGIDVAVNFEGFDDGTQVFPGGQSIDATLVIEGDGTLVEVLNSQGDRGSLSIARINSPPDDLEDTTTNRSATGLVIIRDDAEVNIRQSINIGDANNIDGATADGSLLIEGEGTQVTVGSETRTGDNGSMRIAEEGGSGALIIRDGAELTLLAGDEFGGGIQLSGGSDRLGGDATAIITGAGTRIIAEQGSIEVGRNGGDSRFTASDGAIIDALFFTSGRSGSAETVFEGEGTELNLSGSQVVPEFGAFLTVGRDTDGSFIVRDGADIAIIGDGEAFPGFQAGRNDGGLGVISVTGVGSTITVDGADNVETGEGETGFLRAGRDAGSDGTINVLDGGVITNDPTGILITAQEDGSRGAVNVDGAGSVFDFGATASLSSFMPGASGESVVTVSNGGLLRGDRTVVGETATIDVDDGTIDSDVELFGSFEVGEDVVSSATVDGNFTQDAMGVISFDITDFTGGVGDLLLISGDASFASLANSFELDIAPSATFVIGDTYTLATANTVTAQTVTISDVNSGIDFELSADGNNLVLEALENRTAPIASPGSLTGDEDTLLSGSVSATDADGDVLSFAIGANAFNGSATVSANGDVTYTPNVNFNGTDSFTYTVSDGNGNIDTNTVTVTVSAVNDAPIAAAGLLVGDQDTTFSGSVNAIDEDGDTLTFAIGANASNGTATVATNGTVNYTPNANFVGSDSFTFSVSDGNGGTDTETVDITVNTVEPELILDEGDTGDDLSLIHI